MFMDLPKKRNDDETFDRADFTAPARLLQERNTNGKVKHEKNCNYSYTYQVMDETMINIEHQFANNIDFESQPSDCFNFFFQ